MIIAYDMTQGIPAEKRIQSLAESVQRAMNELENQNEELLKRLEELEKSKA